jgi:hypothetical protein
LQRYFPGVSLGRSRKTGLSAMRMSEFVPQSQRLEHAKCECCGARMWLARIEPDNKPDHDRRTFECAVCKSERVKVVKYR